MFFEEKLRAGLAHHDATCPMPAQAILLHPSNFALLELTEFEGLPVQPHEGVTPGRFEILCDGSAARLEEQMDAFLQQPNEIEVS